ncbi:MAG: CHASE2 domain-containing protein, partial [Deltaproteobacteria bacterium]
MTLCIKGKTKSPAKNKQGFFVKKDYFFNPSKIFGVGVYCLKSLCYDDTIGCFQFENICIMTIKNLLKPSYIKIAASISILFAAIYLIAPSFFGVLELKTIDARFRGRPVIKAGGDVVIATIDEKSLDELGRWPWPRATITRLIDALTSYGAKVIVFDIVFSEPDEHSELKALLSFKEHYKKYGTIPREITDYIHKVGAELDPDTNLGKAIERSARVVLGYFFNFEKVEKDVMQQERRELSHGYREVEVLKESGAQIISAPALESNIDAIARGAKGFGYYNIIPDDDGSVRWAPRVIGY